MGIVKVSKWSTSREQREISLYHSESVSLSTSSGAILFIGGVHGDEPEGVALANGLLQWLKTRYDRATSEIADLKPWVLIPCLNPDGFANKQRVNGAGVDLNRNYPASTWISAARAPRYYPGSQPASEPEIQSLVELIAAIRPSLIVHFHAWNPCIVLTGPPGKWAADPLAEASGYNLQETIGYDTPGSLSDYGWGDLKIPVICIEEQEGAELASVWPRFQSAFSKILTNGEAAR